MKSSLLFVLAPWYPLRDTVFLVWYWSVHFQSSSIIYVFLNTWSDWVNMDWIVLSNYYFDTNGSGGVVIVGISVYILIFNGAV